MFTKAIFTALRAILIASIFSLSLVLPVQAQVGSLHFDTLSVENGLSQSTVWAIYQDREGFMWFGTDDGLNKYDGYEFTIYKNDPEDGASLIDNTVLVIFQDTSGVMWFGTVNGLDRFDRSTEQFHHYRYNPADPKSLIGTEVTAIVEGPDGGLWVGTSDGGLNRLDPATGTFTRFRHAPDGSNSIADDSVFALHLDASGNLWIGTNAGLDCLNLKSLRFTHFESVPPNPNTLSDNRVRSITADSNGKLWIGTEKGLNRLNPKTRTVIRYLATDEKVNALKSSQVRAILFDSQGKFWIGGRNGLDLLDLDQNQFSHYQHNPNDPHSLSSDAVYSMFEDRSGTVWIGTYGGGLSRYNRTSNKFALYEHIPNQANNLSDNVVYSIYEDTEGFLWVGTMNGGLNRLDRKLGIWTVFQHDSDNPNSLSDNEVRAIIEDDTGDLWIGTAGGGLNRLDKQTGRYAHYTYDPNDSSSISDNYIRVLFKDSLGTLWIGTRDGGLNRYDAEKDTFTRFTHDPSEPSSMTSNDVRAIYEDRSGKLWIGTYGGVNILNKALGNFEHYLNDPANPNTISSNRILSFYQDADGKMWIGTLLGGLNRLDVRTKKADRYTEKNGLPNSSIYGILGDDRGNLWLSTNRGLSRFTPWTGVFRNYDVTDGLQNNEFNSGAYFKSWDGEMFFGGVKGFNSFYPNDVKDNPVPPKVIIKSFQKFNQVVEKEITQEETIELSYLDNFISFEFAALDYNAPEKNQYAYKLDGFDEDWIFSGTRNYASYTNLRGGRYTFHVIASNNDGIWDQKGIAVTLVVTPPLWERWWFLTLTGIGVLGLLWGGYQMRVKRIQTQNWILENQVKERTQEAERRREVAEGLQEIIALLNSNKSLDESLARIISQVVRVMDPQAAIIFRRIPGRGQRIVAGSLPGQIDPSGAAPDGQSLPEWMTAPILAGKSLVVPDRTRYLNSIDGSAPVPLIHEGAVLGVPVAVNDQVDGGLILFYEDTRIFSDEDQTTAATFADHVALSVANAHLRSQAEEIAVLAERSRLARDLHDAVTQTLFATSLISEVLPRIWEKNPEEGKKKLDEIRELTRGALAEMRTLLMELRPTALMDVPLSDLLQQLCEAFRGRARVPVAFSTNDRCSLPAEVQTGFYRIAQEALNNIAKHARATHVEVTLTCAEDRVELVLFDNGCGFDPSTVLPDHFGLEIMVERAQSMHAHFGLYSQPGAGTRIQVIWQKTGTNTSQQIAESADTTVAK